jgi:hypothetical protein
VTDLPTPKDSARPTSDPVDGPEERAVAALLRQLPDPEPPEDLPARVMARIAELESRPRVVRGAFRRLSQPAVAAALAAGLATFFVVTGGELPGGPTTEALPLVEIETPRSPGTPETAVRRVAERHRRPVAPLLASAGLVGGQPVAFFAADRTVAPPPGPAPIRVPSLDQRLDRQLDQLLTNPGAFFQRLERVHERDRFVARLAGRAARRGDSADVALRVRSTRHPLTPHVVEEFLRATLVHGTR